MINTERLKVIRDAIADRPLLYNQSNVGAPRCGTPGCLIGWYQSLFRYPLENPPATDGIIKGLGLPENGSILSSVWPIEYAKEVGFIPERPLHRTLDPDFFDPTPDECLKVLDAIIADPEQWYEIIK